MGTPLHKRKYIPKNSKWTYEALMSKALLYRYVKDWRANDHPSYVAGSKSKWGIIEFTKHLEPIPKHRNWLTYYLKNPIEGAKRGIFYVLEFKHKSKNHHFIKVGITSKSIKERYVGKEYKDYEYTILVEYVTTNLKSAQIEDNILSVNQHNRYSFNNHIEFGGFTEKLQLKVKSDILMLEELSQKNIKMETNEDKKL